MMQPLQFTVFHIHPNHKKCHRKKGKHTNEPQTNSMRKLNQTWRIKRNLKAGTTNGSSLDIGKNMEEVAGSEKIFYQDQLTARKCRISEEIDSEYAAEMEARHALHHDIQ